MATAAVVLETLATVAVVEEALLHMGENQHIYHVLASLKRAHNTCDIIIICNSLSLA